MRNNARVLRVVGIELTEALWYDYSVPGGRDSRQLGGTAAVPQSKKNQETSMEREDEMEMVAILRRRPDLIGLVWQLIAEATERVAARQAAERDRPESA